jgi:hypothetical protein
MGHSYGGVAMRSREAVKFFDAEAAEYRALLTELGLAKSYEAGATRRGG